MGLKGYRLWVITPQLEILKRPGAAHVPQCSGNKLTRLKKQNFVKTSFSLDRFKGWVTGWFRALRVNWIRERVQPPTTGRSRL
jgi:hypothetical protein